MGVVVEEEILGGLNREILEGREKREEVVDLRMRFSIIRDY